MKAFWLTIRNNPVFVTFWTAFTGALAEQFLNFADSGKMDWTLKGCEKMLIGALVTGGIALAHLYLPKPGTNPNPS